MTIEEKKKAIDALKISAPVMAVTQEEFTDYIQTLNKIMDWLEQETVTDVFDKIRAEFEEHAKINQNLNTDIARAICWCLDIIDKYMAESEVIINGGVRSIH